MTNYFKLLDLDHKGTIVRTEGPIQYRYDAVAREWIRSGIFIDYLSEWSDVYELYEEISREEALEIIEHGSKKPPQK